MKDVGRLHRAYDDSQGVTAAFNKNVLEVINRRLGGHFELECFDHLARFDPYDEWIEMYLRSRVDQVVRVDDLGLEVPFRRDELMRTEISAKLRQDRIRTELASVALEVVEWWTDIAGDFGVSLSVMR